MKLNDIIKKPTKMIVPLILAGSIVMGGCMSTYADHIRKNPKIDKEFHQEKTINYSLNVGYEAVVGQYPEGDVRGAHIGIGRAKLHTFNFRRSDDFQYIAEGEIGVSALANFDKKEDEEDSLRIRLETLMGTGGLNGLNTGIKIGGSYAAEGPYKDDVDLILGVGLRYRIRPLFLQGTTDCTIGQHKPNFGYTVTGGFSF